MERGGESKERGGGSGWARIRGEGENGEMNCWHIPKIHRPSATSISSKKHHVHPPRSLLRAPRLKRNQFPGVVSRILFWRAPHGTPAAHSFLCRRFLAKPAAALARRATNPGPLGGPPGPLFGLAPDWVCHASAVASEAVGSYPAFAALPSALARGLGGLIFCDTFRRAALNRAPPLSRGILP